MGREIEIRTARSVLRSFRMTDVEDARAYRDDPEFARFLPHVPRPFTRADAEAFVALNMTEPWETMPTFAIVLEDRVIGTVNFMNIDPAIRSAMLGYAIARAHWGRGIAVEAATAAIDWAFAEHDLAEIWASTDVAHLRSRRVMEKLGMTLDGGDERQVVYRLRRDDHADLPIRVDFREPATARTWIEDTRIRRPYRPRFFAAFCAALASRPKLRILELGSGPGQLARELLVHCDVHSYVALDFSPAMHAIAAEHLGELASRVSFVTRDFREPTWPDDLGTFDAVVTLQAAHETRHKRHLVPLLERARTRVAPGGVLLYADHYLTPETKLPALAPARDDQPLALERAGFVDVELRYEEENMALWCGTNPVATGTR